MTNLNDSLKWLHEYPNIIEFPPNSKQFTGTIICKEKYYRLRLYIPKFPNTEKMTYEVYENGRLKKTKNNSEDYENIYDFLASLKDELFADQPKEINDDNIYLSKVREVMKQISSLNLENYTVFMNLDGTKIKVSNFQNYGNHFLEMSITDQLDVKVTSHSLPNLIGGSSDLEMFKSSESITNHISKFLKYLEDLEEFYHNLNTIDHLCFIVDPTVFSTKFTHRIFKFNEKVFLKILIDPLAPSSITFNFIGPTTEVESLRDKFNERMKDWDIDLDIYKNLLRMFDLMYFPMKADENDLNNKYCSICYEYRMNNSIPLITCDNPKCDLIFHVQCLNEWFSTLMKSKTFLTVTCGTCPFCKEKLSTTFAELIENSK